MTNINVSNDMELIGVRLITRLKKSDKAYVLQYYCNKTDCPLLAKGQCINVDVFKRCIYGKVTRVDGWTERAKKYRSFIKEWREKEEQYQIEEPKQRRVTYIGDYVWLPYSHINMQDRRDGLVFESYSHIFSSGEPCFMRRSGFTPEAVVKIAEFRPQAVFGGEITAYAKEIVPKFLSDLMEVDPSLFARAAELKPEIVEIAEKFSRQPVSFGWLQSIKWSGNAEIDGKPCFVYSMGYVDFKLDGISEFPDAIGEVEVQVTLPKETMVYLDPGHYTYMRIMNRARKDGEIS